RLGQALQVQHGVIGLLLQFSPEGTPGGTRGAGQRGLAPAPQVAFNDAVDALATPHQWCKSALHHPVDLRLRQGAAHVLHSRHRMDHVAQRGQLDYQYPQCAASWNEASGFTERNSASIASWM